MERQLSRSVSCARCATEAPASAKFCAECGNRIGATTDAERRIITVLFADLSGFTALTEQLDPEQVRSLIAGCLNPLCDCVTQWGGFVDKFMGDCVMALFGAPIAYENEEERAVRAALDMRDALHRWAASDAAVAIWESLGAADDRVLPRGSTSPLRLKVGVNTGSVVTGVFVGGGAHNYTAVGDAVNVAARLQGACEPGEIVIGSSTYEQTSHLFEFGDERSLVVKGKQEPVRARSVIGLRTERGRSRGFRGRVTRFIGRETQLESLRANWSRAKAGQFGYCLVSGAPGIGKTRLIEEFRTTEELGPEEFARGRSYPYARSAPWEPLAELLRDLYDVSPELEPLEAAAVDREDHWSGVASRGGRRPGRGARQSCLRAAGAGRLRRKGAGSPDLGVRRERPARRHERTDGTRSRRPPVGGPCHAGLLGEASLTPAGWSGPDRARRATPSS